MIKKILIVDSQFIVRSRMSLLLEKEFNGIFVFGVNDFQGALSACATIIFDLVILDINLPDGKKHNMIDELRKLQKDVKILIFSAQKEDTYALRYIQAGANGYLNKLNSRDTIIKAVKTVLESGKYISNNILDSFIAFSQDGRESSSPLKDTSRREF